MKSYWETAKYSLAIIFLLVCLGALGLFNLIMRPTIEDAALFGGQIPPAHVEKGNIFEQFFTEPFESMVLLAQDGTFYTMTTQHDLVIAIQPAQVYEFLLKENLEVKDLVIIIHNHLSPAGFSPGDDYFYRYFVKRGFQGAFCIYYPATRHVLVKEE